MRWRRYRLQVKPREPLDGAEAHEWSVPCPRADADGYHFSTADGAIRAAAQTAQFWARLRVWDSRDRHVEAAWHDGTRSPEGA